MNRGAWWATVHRVAKSWRWLKQLGTHKYSSQRLEQDWTGPYFSRWIDGHQCNYAKSASQLSCWEWLPDSLGRWSCWSPRSARSCFQRPNIYANGMGSIISMGAMKFKTLKRLGSAVMARWSNVSLAFIQIGHQYTEKLRGDLGDKYILKNCVL